MMAAVCNFQLAPVFFSGDGFAIKGARKYYLVDSGYANQPGFLAPYRGQRYHFQEYRRASQQPQGREEIYNHRFEAQVAIVLACCTLHNFIRKETHVDPIFNDATMEAMIDEIFEDDDVDVQPNASHSRSRPMDIICDYINDSIWNASQHP
ncbi:uncharacterized protein LOC132302780 isoform X2 [Cornus florida]|uniref:uncharacterized protein LOC132302780 isoform X2 n=1 Tax=Cornus florida TaxID=4283 RepID=UPI0028A2C1F0|nr:uncharacterized protein LOC132302780 isoform X2 [Cornus florida]